MHGREEGLEFGILGSVLFQAWNSILGGIARMVRIIRTTLRWLVKNLASFDVVKVLRTHWMDMPCFPTVMTVCSFHPFEERKCTLAGIDNISTVLVTGRKLMEGIGGVLMLAIHASALSFLCSEELKVLDFQIRKNGDKFLVEGR
jgi:hypothetical protein